MSDSNDALAKADEAIRFLAQHASDIAGQLQAVQAVLHGILLTVGKVPQLEKAILEEFEKCVAHNLGASTNQIQVDSFDNHANLFRLAMAKSRSDAERSTPAAAPADGEQAPDGTPRS